MTRTIKNHTVQGEQTTLEITVQDQPGSGGACHHYWLHGFDPHRNASINLDCFNGDGIDILFQNGPVPTTGANGVTVEALLAVCIDRLRCFQAGPFPCHENQVALNRMEDALSALQSRTLARIARNVEGKEQA